MTDMKTTAAVVLLLTTMVAVTESARQKLCGAQLEYHFEKICKPHAGPFKRETPNARTLIDGEQVKSILILKNSHINIFTIQSNKHSLELTQLGPILMSGTNIFRIMRPYTI